MTEKSVRAAIAAACAYEIYALMTRRVPTVSRLCRRHRSLEAALLIATVVHFHWEEEICRRLGVPFEKYDRANAG